ncbi:Bidirectional sugar transporter SWEET16 [Carex littledalei]|uniref:Bidirectional sugar transporter SWEET n=1 Tax=Carex littledalei TaxID=544730 RepID=A0A833QAM8_9POAL|nr:Bidirectional sugar transporter SWEET16 [Carex littledalei]
MTDVSFIVGIVGNVISILVFASPITTFWRIVRKKSTEDFKWLPYVTTLLSTSLWSFYGILKPDGILIVTVNGAGAVLEAIYVILYLIYAPKQTKLKMLKLVAAVIAFLALVVLITLFAFHGSIRLLVVGVLCAALTIGMYAAPMAAMTTVIKIRSVEYMPFSLSFFLFLNGGIWSIYALLVKDFFIGVPNAFGFALGTTQLIVYFIYMRKTPLTKDGPIVDEEQGSSHLVGKLEMVPKGHLIKGSSLPKQSVSRQDSAVEIIKAFSMPPLELHNLWKEQDHAQENGAKNASL